MGKGFQGTFKNLNLPEQERDNILGGLNPTNKFRSSTAGDDLLSMGEVELQKEETALVGNTNAETVKAAPSRFNPFNVFRFRKFGGAQGAYDLKMHSDSNLYGASGEGLLNSNGNVIGNIVNYISNVPLPGGGNSQDFNVNEYQKTVRNPTANQIIDFSRNKEQTGVVGPTPYAYNDFIYCTHYGKIPNNRLVTLRRYPEPVEDSLRYLQDDDDTKVKVPLAQALTYYGNGTGNEINQVLPISWDMPWVPKEADVRDIKGNEILIDDVLKAAEIEDPTSQQAVRVGAAAANGNQGALELAGYDAKLQEYIRKAYDLEGPYWNRVLGPVNVVNKNMMRNRGMGNTMFETPIKLKFSFTLRSFNFINPRVAFLDLLTNMLTLTYNTAPFWGGGYRYFKNPGVAINSAGSAEMEKGNIIEGIKLTLQEWIGKANTATDQILNQLADVLYRGSGGQNDKVSNEINVEYRDASDSLTGIGKNVFNALLASRSENLMQAPLSYRSLLEGKPVGEWHMVVGNPMDPMAVMGNLICTACNMKFSNELGADDFPKEVSFELTLKHGRPRAKQDIESIFNLGGGPLSFSKIKPPSSTRNTFGAEPESLGNGTRQSAGIIDSGAANDLVRDTNLTADEVDQGPAADDGLNIYRGRVANHYGTVFGSSSVLNDYIKKSAT